MNRVISDTLLAQVSEFVANRIGLHFPRDRRRDLERGIHSAARDFGFDDEESCIQWLLSSSFDRSDIEILAGHLTVGETYFFREKKTFDILETHVLPELITSRRRTEKRMRIWSAGCSTGEEPYSIAILLNKMIPDLNEWNITILAADINTRFLKKAADGKYGEWSFRDTPPWIRDRWFRKRRDGRYEALPHLLRMVTFCYLNLAEDVYPSLANNTNAMDVIFCRNMLMYFEPSRAKKVVQNLNRSLADGGWLIVSPAEVSQFLFSEFVTVNFPGAILYRKENGEARQPEGESSHFAPSVAMPANTEIEVPPPVEAASHSVCFVETPDETNIAREPQLTQENRYSEAVALSTRGCYEEASEKIQGLISCNAHDSLAMIQQARTYANQGKLAEALEWCKKSLDADRLNPVSHYLLAIILVERGQGEEAVESFKRTLYLDQNFVLAHIALGNLALWQGKSKESRKHFSNVLSLLSACRPEEIVPESGGVTAARLAEIVKSLTAGRNAYARKRR
ncbi:MAG: tetratricopeptide repeat protein [Candidatus Lindowbacteria bacterium]|nr:tetratricopeptide repeat protein [Candidatus Lindowbacteria bacterium]